MKKEEEKNMQWEDITAESFKQSEELFIEMVEEVKKVAKRSELRKVEFCVYSETEFKFNYYIGYFHLWGTDYKEIQTQISGEFYNVSKEPTIVGIVEDDKSGEVFMVSPTSITFIS